jgi:DNA-binding transcriptional MerR regulator
MAEPKSASAFRTIGELSAELGLPQHILRYWETRFPQLRPLVRRIDQALNRDGYTIKGVQKLLKSKDEVPVSAPALVAALPTPVAPPAPDLLPDLIRIRDQLKAALTD